MLNFTVWCTLVAETRPDVSCGNAVLLVQSCCRVALGNPTDTAAGRRLEAAHRYILPPWSWCILQVRRSAASSFSGLSVCVCMHMKEWEGETAHFLCPLIRSVVTMALRRIQLS